MAHKAKGFFYVSLGVLALAVAFHLGARSAGASYVPPGESGIVAFSGTFARAYILAENGAVWEWDQFNGWREGFTPALPVPMADIKFWEYNAFVTRSDEVWVFTGSGGWENVGAPLELTSVPSGEQAEHTTWGRVKVETGR